ncbi:MAG TPA: SRPBCC domain-containing protein [Chitinophagaceae bacterium]
MQSKPFTIERIYNAAIDTVWQAITDKNKMKEWYFDLAEFKPEVGFEFSFYGETEEKKRYLHLCRITEVVVGKKLSYSWRYEDDPGDSLVTFELFPEGNKTKLKLTHSGLETFSASNPDFAKENFEKGWTEIIGTSLKEYVEKK